MASEPFRVRTVRTWGQLLGEYQLLRNPDEWIFRGLPRASFTLATSLERCIASFEGSLAKAIEIEAGLIRRFVRELRSTPGAPHVDVRDRLEVIAVMQHHGAPTRLLDWTYSFYVAAFFALDGWEQGSFPAVWCLNQSWLHDKSRELASAEARSLLVADPLAKNPDTIREVLWPTHPINANTNVYDVNPFNANQRLVVQQGRFVAAGNPARPFMENLQALSSRGFSENVVKIIFEGDRDDMKRAITELNRMNVNRATLFPGFDGFATHLRSLVAMPVAIRPSNFEWEDGR